MKNVLLGKWLLTRLNTLNDEFCFSEFVVSFNYVLGELLRFCFRMFKVDPAVVIIFVRMITYVATFRKVFARGI